MAKFFEGIDSADVFDQGRYLPGGFSGIVEIQRCIIKESRNSGDGFIAEIKVLSGNLPDVQGFYGWWQTLGKDWSLPALKAFMVGIFGIPKDNPDGKKGVWNKTLDPMLQGVLTRAIDEENILGGMRCRVETATRPTRDGGDFTRHDWSAIEGHPDFLTLARSVKALGVPAAPPPVRQNFNGAWYVLVNGAWQPEPAPPPPAPVPVNRQNFNGLWYTLKDNAWVLDVNQGDPGSGACNCKPGGKGRGQHKADCPARKASSANASDDVATTEDDLWDRVRDGIVALAALFRIWNK